MHAYNVFYLVQIFSFAFFFYPLSVLLSSLFIGRTLFNYENPEGSEVGIPRRRGSCGNVGASSL